MGGITGRRVIDYLKQNDFKSSLAKLEHHELEAETQTFALATGEECFSIFSEAAFMQKVNYIHLNPVRADLVERAVDYRWSSAGFDIDAR